MTAQSHDVLVLDMTTLRFAAGGPGSALRVTTRSGVHLATTHPRRKELRSDLAFRALDAALATGYALVVDPHDPRARTRLRVALYNPYSGDIAFGGDGATLTFASGEPLALDADGTRARVVVDTDGATLVIAGREVPALYRTPAELSRVLAQQTAG